MGERTDLALTVAVVVAGGLLGLQGRVNGLLGQHLHSAVTAAAVSFTGGTLLLLGVTAASRTARGAARRLATAEVRWWWWFGGLAGAAVVGSTAAGVPILGIALVSVCIVAGTAAGALAVDHLGLGPSGRHPASVLRVAGAALAVGAVTLGAIGVPVSAARPGLFAVMFVAGAASAVQQAANGQLRVVAGSVAVASLVSFAGGTVALVAVSAALGDLSNRPWPATWWLYTGGALGTVYIALAAATVRRLGVLTLSLATVAGQLVASLILDLVWPTPGARLTATTVLGAGLTLAAVGLAGRRPRRPA